LLSDASASYTPSISERRGAATTFLHSGIKNADAQTNVSGSVSGTRVYDAFGAELSSTGSWQGAFGYAGGFGYQEDTNGFKLLGHRYYDPSTGRFLTRDPIQDGRNWYAYCDSSPALRVDNGGLWWHDPTTIAVSPAFEGKVIAFGDFPWMDREGWRDVRVKPGQRTHPDMDVDMILVIQPNGSQQMWFLMGEGPPGGMEQRSCYYLDGKGRIFGPDVPLIAAGPGWREIWLPVWSEWVQEAYTTGFPKGYEPISNELCVAGE